MFDLSETLDFFPLNQFISDPDDNPAVQDEIDFLDENDLSGVFDPVGLVTEAVPGLEGPADGLEGLFEEIDDRFF